MIISSSKIERLKANGVNATFYGTCPSMKQQGKCWETNMILCVSSFCSFNTNNTRDQLPEFRAGSKYLQDDFNILKDWNLGHFSFNQKSQNFQNRGKWYVISLEIQQSTKNFRNSRSKIIWNRNSHSEIPGNLGIP